MRQKDVFDLQDKIGYRFQDIRYLNQALSHSSYVNESKMNKLMSNERLEFLGDAVLELISSEFLYTKYPNRPEGELTKIRASIVSEFPLSMVAKDLGLGAFIKLSKGEERMGGKERASITSDAVEALLGAIYLDGGINPAKEFAYKFILNDIEKKQIFHDSKTVLQELIQKKHSGTLSYELIHESGPDHDKTYTVQAKLDDVVIGTGVGKTKKHAQQQAAFEAIQKIKARNTHK